MDPACNSTFGVVTRSIKQKVFDRRLLRDIVTSLVFRKYALNREGINLECVAVM